MSPARWLDTLPEPRYTVIVLGEVRIEQRARITTPFAAIDADLLTYAAVEPLVAGTAVNFARHARRHFASIAVAGRIGDDAFTPVIRSDLRELGVTDLLRAEPGQPNGCSVMVRDPSVRLLIAGESAPHFTVEDVRAAEDAIASSDLLFADGYALLSPDSRQALLEAFGIARSHGTQIAFDLVPHDLPERLSIEEVRPALEAADVIISESHTIAGLLRVPEPSPESLDASLPHDPLWLIRHGETSLENTTAYQRDRLNISYATGYGPAVDRIGFGDRLAASELYWWLSRVPAGS